MRSLAVRGGLAVGLSQAVRIGTQVVSAVVLSRLLQPGDFGLIAALTPFLAFIGLFQGMGLQQAIIRHRDMPAEQLGQIFWLTFLVSLICASLIAASSPGVAAFYRDDRLRRLTVAAAVPLFVGSIASLPMAMLSRELRFGTVALIDGSCTVIGLVAALIAALLGAGYWSLLASSYASSTLNLLAGWIASRWRPGRPTWHLPSRALLGFGANLSGFTLLNFFARNLDNVLIGRVSGSVSLGYYDRAYTLMLFPLQAINGPISGVMVPLLSRIEADKPQLRSVYLRTMNQVVLLSLPGIAALVTSSDDVVRLLFGAKWAPVAPIFAWLGIAALWQPVGNSTGWLFISQGRTKQMFHWGVYASVTTVIAFFVGLPWGTVGIAAAYTISDYVLRAPALFWYVGRVGPVRMADLVMLLAPFFVAAFGTFLGHAWLIRGVLGLRGTASIAATVMLSYALGILAVRLSPGGRMKLADSLGLVAQVIRMRPGKSRA